MNRYVDFISSLILSCFVILMWKFKNIFTASPNEFYFGISTLILFNLTIFTKIYCTFLMKTKLIFINFILSFLLLYCWFTSTIVSIISNYNIADTIITFLCFVLSIIQFITIILNIISKYKKSCVEKNNKKEVPL